MHKFRDNAVTGDIPLISLVLTSMVPPLYLLSKCPGFLGYTSSGCPTVCVLARLCWAFIGAGGGGERRCLNASMDKFSGLGITSAFCSVPLSFVSLMRIYTAFLFSRFPQMYKISAIYSVNDRQETRET